MKRNNRVNIRLFVYGTLALFIIVFLITFTRVVMNVPGTVELQNYRNAEASSVFSEDGILLGKYFLENRTSVSLDQIPGHLVNALIATEDARFLEHKGYDARSSVRVLVKTLLMNRKSSGGGSTITQQLAKNMFGRKKDGLFPVLRNKLSEVLVALRIEKLFSKEDILEMYLNTVSFGENVYGIEAASKRFYGKSASSLKIEDSAVLVGMLKANTSYNPRLNPSGSLERRNVVIRQMQKYGYLNGKDADSLVKLPLVINYSKSEAAGLADYFLVQVKHELVDILRKIEDDKGKRWDPERDGLVISTTLNSRLQGYATRAFRTHLSRMQELMDAQFNSREGKRSLNQLKDREMDRLNLNKRAHVKRLQEVFSWKGSYTDSLSVADSLLNSLKVLHAGLLAMDPWTGAVKTWIGGIDFQTHPYDQVLARRQIASVFKPVIYVTALEDGWEPCQYLDNDSISLEGFNDWSPENYDHSYGGKYSLSGALSHSMNIPTFNLFMQIGFEKINYTWKALGFSFPLDNTPSLAMGTAEANLKEVAVAYSAFANGGMPVNPFLIQTVKTSDGNEIYNAVADPPGNQIISGRSCQLINAMLQKAVREGTGITVSSVYGVTLPLAGKTGTSQDYSDAWFAAYNPGLVIVSRVGASTPSVHFKSGSLGSGSALALPLVALTLNRAQQDPSLVKSIFKEFPDLPPDLAGLLNCPDYREKSFFDKIFDIFERDKRSYPRRQREDDRKIRNFFRRIIKRR